MLRRGFTVILVPSEKASARRFSIPYLAMVPVLLTGILVLYGCGVLIYQKEMIQRQNRQVVGISEENASLKRQNSLLSEEASQLAQRVEDIAERAEQFETVLGFDSGLDLAGGIGGVPERQGFFGSSFTGRLRLPDLAGLRDETRDVAANLEEVEQTFKERSELLAAVPSISPVEGTVTSGYGYRFDPFTGVRTFHSALDISNPRGAPVVATADGTVTDAGYEAGHGLSITVVHGYGFSTRYSHLLGIKVKVGQKVKKGEIIGVVGSTGRSTGYHLHYQVRIKDEPVDPSPYMVELTQQASFAARLEESLLDGARSQGRGGLLLGKAK